MVRIAAAKSFWQVTGETEKPIAVLIPCLTSRTVRGYISGSNRDPNEVIPDWRPRHGAARALGQMGPAASSAIPALEKAARDKDSAKLVLEAVEEALRKIRAAGQAPKP